MKPGEIARDSRGWYCLRCSWPGADFVHNVDVARAHTCERNPGEAKD